MSGFATVSTRPSDLEGDRVTRPVRRGAAAALTGLATVLLTAGPAWADNPIGPAEGEEPGKGLGTLASVLLFVGIPLLTAVIVFAAVWLPGAVTANRYRPGKGWSARPVWFAGPADPLAAVEAADTGDVVRGGASGSW